MDHGRKTDSRSTPAPSMRLQARVAVCQHVSALEVCAPSVAPMTEFTQDTFSKSGKLTHDGSCFCAGQPSAKSAVCIDHTRRTNRIRATVAREEAAMRGVTRLAGGSGTVDGSIAIEALRSWTVRARRRA